MKNVMIRKFGLLILVVCFSLILASIYGIIHNQITYSISSEYFTKFKFEQFGFWDYAFENDDKRKLIFIGILSTCWFGLLIGLILGTLSMFKASLKTMWRISINAIIRTLIITIGFGIIGFLIGNFFVPNFDLNWKLPADLIDKKNFLTAGSIHNSSYLGGLIGLIYGTFYILKNRKTSA